MNYPMLPSLSSTMNDHFADEEDIEYYNDKENYFNNQNHAPNYLRNISS